MLLSRLSYIQQKPGSPITEVKVNIPGFILNKTGTLLFPPLLHNFIEKLVGQRIEN